MFAQQFNAMTGKVEWIQVQEEGITPGLADSLYLDMLTDQKRNRAYAECLKQVVTPGQHVLDIGTGTGLLAMLAAKHAMLPPHGDQVSHVTACEVYPPMVKLAEQLIAHNHLIGSVNIFQKRSDELSVQAKQHQTGDTPAQSDPASAAVHDMLHPDAVQHMHQSTEPLASAAAKRKKYTKGQALHGVAAECSDMPCKADVIVTEIFDSELLGEGILPTMRHAVKHLLQPGGVVIPATAVVYGQLVQCPILAAQSHQPQQQHFAQQSMSRNTSGQAGSDSPCNSNPASAARGDVSQEQGPDAAMPRTQMHAMHVGPLYPDHMKLLSEPFEVFQFDFEQPPEGDRSQKIQIMAVTGGTAHAIVMWWKLNLDRSGHIILDTAPPWVTHPPQSTYESAPKQTQLSSLPEERANAETPTAACPKPEDQSSCNHGMQSAHQPEQQWRDHWKQCWTPLQPHILLEAGSLVQIAAHHDATSIRMTASALHPPSGPACTHTGPASNPAPQATSLMPDPKLPPTQQPVNPQPSSDAHKQTVLGAAGVTSSLNIQVQDFDNSLAGPGASPNRLWMLADDERTLKYDRAVQQLVAGAGPEAVCITSGAGARLALIAAACENVQQVICLQLAEVCVVQETTGQQRRTLQAARAAQLLHKVTVADGQQVLGSEEPAALLAELSAGPVTAADVFLSEPFYASLESLPPWSHCRCWHDRDVLLAAGLLKPFHQMLPCAGKVCGVGVSLPDLWRTRAPVEVEQGVDLAPCNTDLGAVEAGSGGLQALALSRTSAMMTRSMWQCGSGYQEVTERVDLLAFDFSKAVSDLRGTTAVTVLGKGTMHALVTWTEYKLTPDDEQWMAHSPSFDGSPGYNMQAVQLLQAPGNVCERSQEDEVQAQQPNASCFDCQADFDANTGNIVFDLSRNNTY